MSYSDVSGSLARAVLGSIETAARGMYDHGTFAFARTLTHAGLQRRFTPSSR